MISDSHTGPAAETGPTTGQVIWLHRISAPRQTPSLCDFLHQGTRALRTRRDATFDRLDLSLKGRYAAFLSAEAEALFPLEAALERGGIETLLPDWRQRARSLALSRDLAALGAISDPLPMPQLIDAADMLGVCYALEASRMGERIVLTKLSKTTTQPAGATLAATSFLRHGTSQRFWPSFTNLLEGNPEAQAHPARVLRAAQMAFGMFDSAQSALWRHFDFA